MSIVVFVLLVSLTYRSLDRTDGERMRLAAVLLEEAERRHLAKRAPRRDRPVADRAQASRLRGRRSRPSRWRRRAALVAGAARARVEPVARSAAGHARRSGPAARAGLAASSATRARPRSASQFAHSRPRRARCRPSVETAAYRIVQEALTNVARHAGVDAGDGARLGHGERAGRAGRGRAAKASIPTPSLAPAGASGLSGMRERAAALGGQLTIEPVRATARGSPPSSRSTGALRRGPRRMKTISVVLADDHQVVLEGLQARCSPPKPIFEVVGEATDGLRGGLPWSRSCKPEVLVVDLMMPGLSGLEVVAAGAPRASRDHASSSSPCTPTRPTWSRRCSNGAAGYVLKRREARELVDAIRAVRGGAPLPEPAALRGEAGAYEQRHGGAVSISTTRCPPASARCCSSPPRG